MAEYKKMKLEDVFADIEKIMGADASDEEKSMQLRKKAASAYEQEDDPAAAAYYDEAIALGCVEADMLPEILFRGGSPRPLLFCFSSSCLTSDDTILYHIKILSTNCLLTLTNAAGMI